MRLCRNYHVQHVRPDPRWGVEPYWGIRCDETRICHGDGPWLRFETEAQAQGWVDLLNFAVRHERAFESYVRKTTSERSEAGFSHRLNQSDRGE